MKKWRVIEVDDLEQLSYIKSDIISSMKCKYGGFWGNNDNPCVLFGYGCEYEHNKKM